MDTQHLTGLLMGLIETDRDHRELAEVEVMTIRQAGVMMDQAGFVVCDHMSGRRYVIQVTEQDALYPTR